MAGPNAQTHTQLLPALRGHMSQTRKKQRSTQRTVDNQTDDDTDDVPTQEPNNAATHKLFVTIKETGRIYTDQTGRFPVTSSRGNKYVMVLTITIPMPF
jgi:hypothetical protein